ncbi:hypothetical protein Golob_011908 [Gossypium lobatum]|uniref:Uncharacterized protein n=1 Tax=Gossypium lobatum TaxID=34289 RepID=A0A7J8MRF2_9ROSI|nr:hypothetical protein [Gossypium lobatum]
MIQIPLVFKTRMLKNISMNFKERHSFKKGD